MSIYYLINQFAKLKLNELKQEAAPAEETQRRLSDDFLNFHFGAVSVCGTNISSDIDDNMSTFFLKTSFRKQVNFYYGQIWLSKWPAFFLSSKSALL